MTLRQRYRLHTHVTIWGLVILGAILILTGAFLAEPDYVRPSIAAGASCNLAAIMFAIIRFTNRRYYFSDEVGDDDVIRTGSD